jgi:hypothetical protein
MKGKILFVAGAAVGYVLGARAGRGAYVKIKSQAESLWENPSVQKTVQQAEGFVKENAPVVGKKIQEVAGDAASKAKSVASKSGDADVKEKVGELADKAKGKASEVADAASDKAGASGRGSKNEGEPGSGPLPGVNAGE